MKCLSFASLAAALFAPGLAACNAQLEVDPGDGAVTNGSKDSGGGGGTGGGSGPKDAAVADASLPKDTALPDKALAKDTMPKDTAVPDAVPVSAEFQKVYDAVFRKYGCSGCHAPGDLGGGLNLVGAATVFGNIVDKTSIGCPNIKRIDPGKPETSLILGLLRYSTLTDAQKMMAVCDTRKRGMPPGGMVDPADAQVLEDWIAGGAK